MTDREEIIRGLQIERECVSRDCDRDCGKCDLVQERDWLLSVYDGAIALLKEQEPVKPKQRNPHLGAWWHECGNCDKAISPGDNYCRGCGRAIDWSKIVGVRGSENHKAWEAAQIRL